MSDGFQPLRLEQLSTAEGVRALNDMLETLYNLGSRQSLQYGEATSTSADAYAAFVDGVLGTATAGIRMHKAGSILGHSVLTDVTTATSGDVTFEVRVNDANQAALELEFDSADGTGVASMSRIEPRHSVSFAVGDLISVFMNETGTMVWQNTIGFIEVQFDD